MTDKFVGDPDLGRWWEICFARIILLVDRVRVVACSAIETTNWPYTANMLWDDNHVSIDALPGRADLMRHFSREEWGGALHSMRPVVPIQALLCVCFQVYEESALPIVFGDDGGYVLHKPTGRRFDFVISSAVYFIKMTVHRRLLKDGSGGRHGAA